MFRFRFFYGIYNLCRPHFGAFFYERKELEHFFNLLCLLEAVYGCGKNCHYFAQGMDFRAKHKLADDVVQDIQEWIDEVFEGVYLGRGEKTPDYSALFRKAATLIAAPEEDDRRNFSALADLLDKVLAYIQQISDEGDLAAGEQDLLGRMANRMQQRGGFLKQMLKVERGSDGVDR